MAATMFKNVGRRESGGERAYGWSPWLSVQPALPNTAGLADPCRLTRARRRLTVRSALEPPSQLLRESRFYLQAHPRHRQQTQGYIELLRSRVGPAATAFQPALSNPRTKFVDLSRDFNSGSSYSLTSETQFRFHINSQPLRTCIPPTTAMGSDPQYAKWPLLTLAQHVFTLTNSYATRPAQQAAAKSLQDAITEHKMAPLYRYLAHPLEGILNAVGEGTSSAIGKTPSRKSSAVGMIAARSASSSIHMAWDEALYQSLQADNDRELEEIQKEEDEAVEKAGETEIHAARGKRAEFWARVGDKVGF